MGAEVVLNGQPGPGGQYQLFPALSAEEYGALKADIALNGVLIPIEVTPSGQILDGYHRERAYQELSAEGLPIAWPAPVVRRDLETEAQRKGRALVANLARRHLSFEQRAELRAVQQQVYLELRAEHRTQAEAAAMVGIAEITGRRWEDDPEVIGHCTIASTPPDLRLSLPRAEHDRIAARAGAGESHSRIAADYKVTRERIGQIVRLVEARNRVPEPVVTPGFPEGPFRCIVMDPPWPMQKVEREQRPDQGVALDYADMGLEEIAALPIDRLADERGCHIYLWVTHRFLPAGLELFEGWGVRYQCLMTWVKNVGPTPFSWMYDTEHVLFGRVGALDLERLGLRLSFVAQVTRHSEKPGVFYERVLEASPGPRLELFARQARDGFIPWGNEVVDATG